MSLDGAAAAGPVAAPSSSCVPGAVGKTDTEEQFAKEVLAELQEMLRNKAVIEPTLPGPAQILPHLLLGGGNDARNIDELARLGVTHVLNVAGGEVITGPEAYEKRGIRYSQIKSEDTQEYDIMQHFAEFAELADEAAAAGGRVFVHCFAGVNRSGTLCVAYHAVHTGMPLLDSARYCKQRRGRICTNSGFQVQLFNFARKRSLPLR
mmetsp:Transcript_146204/g.379899  ORF Transcript_146204/g.379899 Transcript_146204/m.379899 type:complete len:207 (+) Transcript_146204:177-797(+)|eukprot:CAMPEP_0115189466 /NCGR_PEP_ID=MMETSP0270-20121206/11530_1 /TAXON_ID=71861 /ORGANISM="Scrippsiella trochoidea, Strain CCMP3099" /LENGTH=206 /DNA_ID=CAMNT_0002602659 /DNA_START=101 /DNA_END=721 /DNA_ORIENTATION=-